MAKFKISRDGSGEHTWKAVGTNPTTGKEMTITGGQAGTKVGKANPGSEKTFDARHDATGTSPKKYINKLRWDNKAAFGSSVNIPDELFGKAATKKAASKKAAAVKKNASKKGAAKKAAPKKTATTKTAAKKAATKKTTAKKGAAKKTASKKTASKKSARR